MIAELATDTAAEASHDARVNRASPAGPDVNMELLERHLPLVKTIVAQIKYNLPPHVDADDLHSVGVRGLILALEKYDPDNGSPFSSYAALRIRGAILDELRRMDWMSRGARANSKRLRQTVDRLEQELGRPATNDEVRRELDLSPEAYQQFMDKVRPITLLPLDSNPASDGGDDVDLHEFIADETAPSVREKMEREETISLVANRINQLPETQRKVLAMYYYENMRLAEIAAVFGLTESRISQIHSQAVVSLQCYLSKALCS